MLGSLRSSATKLQTYMWHVLVLNRNSRVRIKLSPFRIYETGAIRLSPLVKWISATDGPKGARILLASFSPPTCLLNPSLSRHQLPAPQASFSCFTVSGETIEYIALSPETERNEHQPSWSIQAVEPTEKGILLFEDMHVHTYRVPLHNCLADDELQGKNYPLILG